MSTKLTGLAAFTKRGLNQLDTPPSDGQTSSPERQRAKKDVVALTVRLQRAEWERLHQLGVNPTTLSPGAIYEALL
jgi:hypothetical protein